MRIKLTQKLNTPLSLPISYHHILQGIIYNAIQNVPGYETLHDEGYEYGKRRFKMFTFSEIFGRYRIKGDKIIFTDKVTFWISSPDDRLIMGLSEVFGTQGITWGNKLADNVYIEVLDVKDIGDEICIKMLSPICVYSTDVKTREINYLSPDKSKFEELISDNFRRKYEAFTGNAPTGAISIKPVMVLPKDMKVVKFIKTRYECWTGEYTLCGNPEYLRFLHDSGIGGKNSEGFGMFEII